MIINGEGFFVSNFKRSKGVKRSRGRFAERSTNTEMGERDGNGEREESFNYSFIKTSIHINPERDCTANNVNPVICQLDVWYDKLCRNAGLTGTSLFLNRIFRKTLRNNLVRKQFERQQ